MVQLKDLAVALQHASNSISITSGQSSSVTDSNRKISASENCSLPLQSVSKSMSIIKSPSSLVMDSVRMDSASEKPSEGGAWEVRKRLLYSSIQ